jgi:MFS family permease
MVRKLLRIRNVRIFLAGDVVSTLGDSSLWFAMAIWMKELTGSSAWAGLVFFCYIAGNLFSPLGGVLADRFPRRPLLVVANLLSAAIVLPIALVHGRGDIWIVYVVVFLYGVTGSVIKATQSALVPGLVSPDLLAEASGAQQTLNQGLQLVAPLIGAGLFTVVGGAVIAEIDAGTFLVAVVSLLLLRMAPAQTRRPRQRTASRRALRAGWPPGFSPSSPSACTAARRSSACWARSRAWPDHRVPAADAVGDDGPGARCAQPGADDSSGRVNRDRRGPDHRGGLPRAACRDRRDSGRIGPVRHRPAGHLAAGRLQDGPP